jgi:hypothetical protein
MKVYPHYFRQDSGSRIGTYEAFLDLLTLFCFILMFAAAMYVTPQPPVGAVNVETEQASRGSPAGLLPNKDVELKLSKEGNTNRLTILAGPASETLDFEVSGSNINSILTSFMTSFLAASNISIAVFEDQRPVNPEVLVDIQRWMSFHNIGRYRFYFVEPSESTR